MLHKEYFGLSDLKINLLMYTLFLKDQWINSATFYMYYKEPYLIIIKICLLVGYDRQFLPFFYSKGAQK